MMLARSVGRPRASLEERTLSWDEVQQALRSAFFSGEEPDTGQSGAERLSPVAAAHRILTNSFGLIPFGLYRKEGEERVAVDTPELIRVLKIRPNDYMSPFVLRKVVMSNAFWHGFGAVWNRQGPGAGWSSASPCPATAAPSKRTGRRGNTGMTTNVVGVRRTFANYELSFLYFETYDGIRGRGLLDLAREAHRRGRHDPAVREKVLPERGEAVRHRGDRL